MRYYINPERNKKTVNFKDHIVYSTVENLEGKPMQLEFSVMSMNGNSELKAAAKDAKETDIVTPQPAIIWVSGGGYRGVDKNQMIAEIQYLAEEGYAVIMVYYRSSAEGHWPAQLIDVKTAIRYIRAHAKELNVDPDRIGIMGRSAGGHLAAMAGLNLSGYDTEEWSGYSSDVQAVFDMFGPVDMVQLLEDEVQEIKRNPNYRWHTLSETHGGALMGGPEETMMERAKEASAIVQLPNARNLAPIVILHGDADWLIPPTNSIAYYDALIAAGYEDRADLYLLRGAGHGTPEFFQPQVREIGKNFFRKYLG